MFLILKLKGLRVRAQNYPEFLLKSTFFPK